MFENLEDYENYLIGVALWRGGNAHLRDIIGPENFINGKKINGKFINAILWRLISETEGTVFKIKLMSSYMAETDTKDLDGSIAIQKHINNCYYSYHALAESTAAFILLEHAMCRYITAGVQMLIDKCGNNEEQVQLYNLLKYINSALTLNSASAPNVLAVCDTAVAYLLESNNEEAVLFAKSFTAGFEKKVHKIKGMRDEDEIINSFLSLEFTQKGNRPLFKKIQSIIKYMGPDKVPSLNAQRALNTLYNELI